MRKCSCSRFEGTCDRDIAVRPALAEGIAILKRKQNLMNNCNCYIRPVSDFQQRGVEIEPHANAISRSDSRLPGQLGIRRFGETRCHGLRETNGCARMGQRKTLSPFQQQRV